MAKTITPVANDVDIQIQQLLNIKQPVSFFLFAGAGSGKTRSLVKALLHLKEEYLEIFRAEGKQIAVITYTNAACDEIKQRIEFNSIFEVSTIHSFAWLLVQSFTPDIKKWVVQNLEEEMTVLREELAKGRPGTKTELTRRASLASKERRLNKLESVTKFNYNPNGENSGYDSLNHTEVIKIASDFLTTKPLMQHILVSKFPFIFVDESQDTNKAFIEGLLAVEAAHKGRFLLGLFGDTMQRIYLDGKADLGVNLPSHWAKPAKTINHRSPVKVINLINKIRLTVDGQQQTPAPGKEEGFVRLFLAQSDLQNKDKIEKYVQQQMREITGDNLWTEGNSVKKLILEHHMAARRLGFSELFNSLHSVDRFTTGLLDGSLSAIKLFSQLVMPLLLAKERGDDFQVTNILQQNSPLLDVKILRNKPESQIEQLKKSLEAVNKLYDAWYQKSPTFKDLLNIIYETKLFSIPLSLEPFVPQQEMQEGQASDTVSEENLSEEDSKDELGLEALEAYLNSPFKQILSYHAYINEKTEFDTHQGIKGRQFPRVMVIVDDGESRGFLYKYDKLFGVEPLSKTDIQNEREGKDNGVSRPKRLFYVTCSRAEKSLAIVSYTKDVDAFRSHVLAAGWFDEAEIKIIDLNASNYNI